MRRISIAILIVASLASISEASWAYIPLEVLVQESDLMVVGTLNGVSEFSSEGMDYGEGSILVEDVIWGQVAPGETLTLRWQNQSNLACPRVDHSYAAGKTGIWLLTVRQAHEVNANYPGRFVEVKERKSVEKALRKSLVCVLANEHWVRENQPAAVSLIFRNPTDKQLVFPGIEVSGDNLILSPDLKLALYHTDWSSNPDSNPKLVKNLIKPLSNLVVIQPSTYLAPIVVAPGQEHRTLLNLKTLFTFTPGQSYSLEFKVKGHRRGNAVSLYAPTDADEKAYPPQRTAMSKTKKNLAEKGRGLFVLPGVAILAALAIAYRRRTRA